MVQDVRNLMNSLSGFLCYKDKFINSKKLLSCSSDLIASTDELRVNCYTFDNEENADKGILAIRAYSYNTMTHNIFNRPLATLGIQILAICKSWES